MNHEIVSPRVYVWVFVALVILAGATAGISQFDLGPFNFIVSLLIAIGKASLVAAFFMHLRESRPLIRLVVFGSLVWLSLLIGLSMADYLSRSWSTMPRL